MGYGFRFVHDHLHEPLLLVVRGVAAREVLSHFYQLPQIEAVDFLPLVFEQVVCPDVAHPCLQGLEPVAVVVVAVARMHQAGAYLAIVVEGSVQANDTIGMAHPLEDGGEVLVATAVAHGLAEQLTAEEHAPEIAVELV